ncbi:hypothetical protein KP509_25G058500 [Ceratopteris richardii]|uniref:Major facilitator superfamily (MFS) profile domain-containing protein n=1 Tax=Ceratopteris richardii TaxID=49495 RepID=A0A8T2RQK2_CERRI|nr:hypothetical protein KP509_25G058500 [Ceratopteris richardii]
MDTILCRIGTWEGYGEPKSLLDSAGKQSPKSSCNFIRHCKLKNPYSRRVRFGLSIGLPIRSCIQDERCTQSLSTSSLDERLHARIPTAGSLDRGGEGPRKRFREDASNSSGVCASNGGDNDNGSTSTNYHVSNASHHSEMQKRDGVNEAQSSNGTANTLKETTTSMSDGEISSNNATVGLYVNGGPWIKIPHRYKLVLTTSLAFVICNMDKVNLSVAIIPMSNQLHWNASTAGLVQSSFFWGYTLSQIPGGWLATKLTGGIVLLAGVGIWSLATAIVPFVASFIPALLFSRLIVGLGEGVSPSAATDLIARNIPPTERSRAVAFVFNGLNVGSIIGLVLAPGIIEHFGWESVFCIFGVLGVFWCFGYMIFMASKNPLKSEQGEPRKPTFENPEFKTYGKALEEDKKSSFISEHERIPWKAFFRSSAVWAMIYTHFCGNWGHYCIMAWLPTYFSDKLNLSLTNAALVSVIPPLGGMLVSSFAAPMADNLISRGVNVTFVRKLCQSIAFLSPTAGMTLCSLDLGLSPWVTASIITSSLALSSFALGGLYCTHQDISPRYASILLGITNTAGAIPGILGVYLTGVLLDETNSWQMALFDPCIFFWITGTIVWNLFASSEPRNFES